MAQLLLERDILVDCSRSNLGSVVINGVYRVSKKGCDVTRLVYTQSYEREDTKLRIQQFSLLKGNPGFRLEKRIELLYEIRVKLHEGSVEGVVEILELRLELRASQERLEFVQI